MPIPEYSHHNNGISIPLDCCICHRKYEQDSARAAVSSTDSLDFYLSSCSHVFCSAHAENGHRLRQCSYCSEQNIALMKIDTNNMDPEYFKIFEDFHEQLGNLYGISQFQNKMMKQRLAYLEDLNRVLLEKCDRQKNLLIQAKTELNECRDLKTKINFLESELSQRNFGTVLSKPKEQQQQQQPPKQTVANSNISRPVKQYAYNKYDHSFDKLEVSKDRLTNNFTKQHGHPKILAESTEIINLSGSSQDSINNYVTSSTVISGPNAPSAHNTNMKNNGSHVLNKLGIQFPSRALPSSNTQVPRHFLSSSNNMLNIRNYTQGTSINRTISQNNQSNGNRILTSSRLNSSRNVPANGIFQHMKSSNSSRPMLSEKPLNVPTNTRSITSLNSKSIGNRYTTPKSSSTNLFNQHHNLSRTSKFKRMR